MHEERNVKGKMEDYGEKEVKGENKRCRLKMHEGDNNMRRIERLCFFFQKKKELRSVKARKNGRWCPREKKCMRERKCEGRE